MPNRTKLFYLAVSLAGIAFLVFTVWIIHEANIGRDNILFKTVRATPHGDKIGHVLLAGFLTLVLNFFLRNRAFTLRKLILPWGSLAVFAIAVIEEASQYFLPTRSLDIKDALANLLGIILFSIPAILSRRRSHQKR
ncbi:VanZ family protein [Pelagicoccus mobilis]|uniref:VanZ family protein n=1 Tax=Pelagicoccus mobilis TaxID=415221 RepID=A0A934S2G9_9BACT|nr:VanZ family protein [Pelagicoccus mobilis]MBK1880648.1 VanZ family protein [Pelagicoccus mobilis]